MSIGSKRSKCVTVNLDAYLLAFLDNFLTITEGSGVVNAGGTVSAFGCEHRQQSEVPRR